MQHRTSSRDIARRRRAPAGLRAVAGLAVCALVMAVLGAPPLASGDALAAVAQASAYDLVPVAADLPGFRLDSGDDLGGELEPVIAVERVFTSLDGDRRLVVSVNVGVDPPDAQETIDDRVNQLTRYHGWRIVNDDAIGESGYRGSASGTDGRGAAGRFFRVDAMAAEVRLEATQQDLDAGQVEGVARLVESRMRASGELRAVRTGFPTPEPAKLPGKDPPGAPVGGIAGVAAVAPPGGAVVGASGGSPILADTIVRVTIGGVERPWVPGPVALAPPAGTDYLTVAPLIEVSGPTAVEIALPDFTVTTFDGREYAPLAIRVPSLRVGTVAMGSPTTGWLTFRLPTSQQPLQLNWRLRTTQLLADQGGVDQTLVVPLTAGATASASIGTSAPPAGVPVVTVPGPGAPGMPAAPGLPAGPSVPSGPGGGGSGGRPRLQ